MFKKTQVSNVDTLAYANNTMTPLSFYFSLWPRRPHDVDYHSQYSESLNRAVSDVGVTVMYADAPR